MSGAKKGRTEAQRIAAAIKSYAVEYYVSDCETEDDYKGVEACAQALEKSAPNCAVMLVAAGLKKLNVVAVIPEDKREKLSAKDWVSAALAVVGGVLSEESTDAFAFGIVDGNPEEDKFPLKMKDTARGGAFAFLKKNGLVVDEESDDEPDFSAFDC
eukprot:TRINITY_DN3272_c0_g1_i1.p1 TRINITY_DN3272_c0_g1~~TRINITY_DN3272_c0_g1_i1.p1  ORF type:complete len:157 (-),score=60.24 TRINITY_DN3272_c0_g1_i1:46-516(-)